jgi:hypothetical protein
MVRVTLDQFLERTAVHENMPIQVNPLLRRCVWICWPVVAVCLIIFYFVPAGDILHRSTFFLWTKGWMANVWNYLATNRTVFMNSGLAVLALALLLLWLTRAYHRAAIGLHIALFVPVAYATASLLFVFVLLLPFLVNFVIWMILALMAGMFCMFLITILARSR